MYDLRRARVLAGPGEGHLALNIPNVRWTAAHTKGESDVLVPEACVELLRRNSKGTGYCKE